MSARIYGDTLVLLTDGRAFSVFVAPVAGLAADTAAGLRFEKADEAFLAPYTYANLPKDYVATALRVLPRSGEPRSCGISESTGGLSFVVYPLKSSAAPAETHEGGSKAGTVKTEDAAATFAPRSYWRFENASDFTTDETGLQPLSSFEGIGRQGKEAQVWHTQEDGGLVGGWVNSTGKRANDSWATYWESRMGSVPLNQTAKPTAPGITVEMLLKPGQCFGRGGMFSFFAAFPPSKGKACSASVSGAQINWFAETVAHPTTAAAESTGTPVDSMEVRLEGTGVLSADYLSDGGWHHFAFVKDGATGDQSIWIDGQSPAELRLQGNATGRAVATSTIYFNARGALTTCAGVDEIAVYEEALPASMILQHYKDAQAHKAYSTTDPGGAPPEPAPEKLAFDPSEYPPGTCLPTPPGTVTVGVTQLPQEQLQSFPRPRYATQHQLRPNINWMDPGYLGGQGGNANWSDWSRSSVVNRSIAVQDELSSDWNYAIELGGHGCCTEAQNRTIALANAHPERHLSVIIMRAEEPGDYLTRNQSLPAGCYLQNAQGKFINCEGSVTTHKVLRPTTPALAAAVGCPDTVFAHDGAYFRDQVFRKFDELLTRPIDIVNEDGEIFVSLGQVGKCDADPKVKAAFQAFNETCGGAGTWETYSSLWRVRLTTYFRDQFFKATPPIKALQGAHYSEYQVQGSSSFFGNWTFTREIGTPYTQADGTKQYYSTADFYPRKPAWWESGAGAWHGLSWLSTYSRPSELASGDVLFSPFVAAGWSGAVEANIRPAQWLGLLKVLSLWGAEFFYTGFFSLGVPFPNPSNVRCIHSYVALPLQFDHSFGCSGCGRRPCRHTHKLSHRNGASCSSMGPSCRPTATPRTLVLSARRTEICCGLEA